MFDRCEGDSWLMGYVADEVCALGYSRFVDMHVCSMTPLVLLRMGICLEHKVPCDLQLHFCRVSAKQAAKKQQCIEGDAVCQCMIIIVYTITG